MNQKIRQQFPIFSRKLKGHQLVYLDSAVTTQKPSVVLKALDDFYRRSNANTRRGLYQLSLEATELVEQTRRDVAGFIHAANTAEVIFTSGATAAINLVAHTWAQASLKRGDAIALTQLEHHSNLVPWQQLAQRKRLSLHYAKINRAGTVTPKEVSRILNKDVKLLAITHTSNVLGTQPRLRQIIQLAHRRGVRVLVDAAAAVAHQPISVQQLDCDWLVFSGHKMYGPTGTGVLWGRRSVLETAPPWQYGGEMIDTVDWQTTTFAQLPYKFEAGTQHIAGIVGLGQAIRFVQRIGWSVILRHERELMRYLLQKLSRMDQIKIFGPPISKFNGSIVSFTVDGIHPHDVAQILGDQGIAVRAGHHCAMPLMSVLKVPATVRVSLGLYNTKGDIDLLAKGLRLVFKTFKR